MAERLQIIIDVDGGRKGAAEVRRLTDATKHQATASKQATSASRQGARAQREQDAATRRTSTTATKSSRQHKELAGATNAAAHASRRAAVAARGQGDAYTGLNAKLRTTNKGVTGMSGGLLMGTGRMTALGGAAIGAGVALGSAAVTGAKFEQVMDRVAAVSQANTREMKAMEAQAMHLGATTQFSAKEAADGMYQLATAGFTAQQVMKTIPGTLDLAAASGTDLASSAAIQATAIRGFGLEAKDATRVADVLTQVVNSSAVEMADLGETIAYIAPVAKASGQSIEDMMAAVAIMGNVGIKGSQAGTTLRTALVRLQSPTMKVNNALDELGLSVEQLTGPKGLKPIPLVMQKIADGAKKVDKPTRNAALAAIFGREALSGMIALVEAGPAAFKRQIKALKESEGAAKRAADTMRDNVAGAWDNFTGSVETAAIALSNKFKPALKDALNVGAGGVNKFSKGFDDAFAGLLGKKPTPKPAAGPPVPMPTSKGPGGKGELMGPPVPVFAPDASKTRDAFQKVEQEFTNFATRNRGRINQIKGDVAAIWTSFKTTFDGIGKALKDAFSGETGNDIRTIVDALMSVITVAVRLQRNVLGRFLPAFKQTFAGLVQVVKGAVQIIAGILTLDFGKAWKGAKNVVGGAVKAIIGNVRGMTAPLREAATQAFNGVKTAASAVWNKIGSKIAWFVNAVIDVVNFLPFGKDIGKVSWGSGGDSGDKSRSHTKSERGYARGGFLAGAGRHDTVPIMAAPGEAILNRHQQAPVNAALMATYGMNLPQLFNQVSTPHYMARGGYARQGRHPSASSLIDKLPGAGTMGAVGELGQIMSGMTKWIIGNATKFIKRKVESAVLGSPGGPSGLANFDGKQVAKWTVAPLTYARGHGWSGSLTSGYRSHAYNVAQGRNYVSNHEGVQYPGGAVDVGGWGARAEGAALNAALQGYEGARKLVWGGPSIGDWGHFSATGHARGGFIQGFARGGTVGASFFGGPTDPGTGHTGYRGDDLRKHPNSFAELGMGHAMGGLPYLARVAFTGPKGSATLVKRDIGDGGAAVRGHKRAADFWHAVKAKIMGGAGLAVVKYRELAGKGDPKGKAKAKTKAKTKKATPRLSADEVFNLTMSKFDLLESFVDPADMRTLNLYRVERLRVVGARLAKVMKALGTKLRPQTRVRLTGEAVSLRELVKQYSTEIVADADTSGTNLDSTLKDLIIGQQRGIIGSQRTAMLQKGIMDNFVGAFAQGGPVNQTGMALVHKGEYVVPEGGARVGASGAAPIINVYLSGAGVSEVSGRVEVDGRTVQTIDRKIGRGTRRIAVAPGR